MKSIIINIGEQSFPIKVREGEEQNMLMIADYVNNKLSDMKVQLPTKSDSLILVMTCLALAEELFEERNNNVDPNEVEAKTMTRVNTSLAKFIENLNE